MAWKPPATDIETTAWSPPASDMEQTESAPPPSFLQTASNAADRITGTMPAAASIMAPTLGMAQYAGAQMNDASGKLGGAVTEAAGRLGVPGWGAAALGVGASIAGNPMTYVDPEASMSGKFARPVAPAARAPMVEAAQNIGMSLRRGEVTGSKTSLGLSNLMEKTALGSGPEDAFTAEQYSKLNAEKQRLQGSMGTTEDVYGVGQKAQRSIPERGDVMKVKKDAMFEAVPTEVHVPIKNAKQTADTLIDEQSKLYEGTRSPEVQRWAEIVQKAESSSGKGVTGGPEYQGYTEHIPGSPGETYSRQSSLVDKTGKPLSFEETLPGTAVPPRTEYNIKASVGPEQTFAPKPNYFALKKLRENLGEAIGQAKTAGKFQDYRDLTRLKSSLDQDINQFATGQTAPLDDMVAREFQNTYRKANAMSGAYKNLFKSPEAEALANAPPEKIVDMVFKKNNETAVKQFRAMAGEKGFTPAKQKFTQDLLDSTNVTKELGKYEEGTLQAIYSEPELKELRQYGLAQGAPKQVANLQGTHGSARSNVVAAQYGGLGSALLALMSGHPLVAAAGVGQYLAPAAISRLNLHLAEGIPASFGRTSQNLTAGAAGAAVPNFDENRRNAYASFISRITTKDNQ